VAGIAHGFIQVFEPVLAVQTLRLFHVGGGFQLTVFKTGVGGFFKA